MPKIERFEPVLRPKPWGTEIDVAITDAYLGRILLMRAGGSGHLQYHEEKLESFHLFSGRALVEYAEEDGTLRTTIMEPGESYHVPCGAVHRVEALEDSVLFECSLPVFDDRVVIREHTGSPEAATLEGA